MPNVAAVYCLRNGQVVGFEPDLVVNGAANAAAYASARQPQFDVISVTIDGDLGDQPYGAIPTAAGGDAGTPTTRLAAWNAAFPNGASNLWIANPLLPISNVNLAFLTR